MSKLATQAKPPQEDSSDVKEATNVAEIGIKELAACAYSVQPQFKPDLSEKSREVFSRLLASTIGKVMRRRDDAEYLCNVVLSVEPTAVTMSDEIKAEQSSALKAMRKLLKASKKSDGKHAGASAGLALLYAITILQLYDGAPDAISILQDLERCSEKMKNKEGGSSELLVEILLVLVSRQSPMMRQISEQVFEAFTSQVSPEALELLTEPLFTEENEKGYQALFENIEEEEDADMHDAEDSGSGEDVEDVEDMDEDEISEIGSDVEFVTLNGADAADGEEEDDDDEDEEDEDEEKKEADAQELANLDDALAKVLRSHRLDKDKDADSSDNDSDMTDSEMMALDEKLIEVFKQRAKTAGTKKKDKKDAKESVVIFKHRIMDFIALYVKHEAANPLAFNVLLPLLEVVRTTTAKPLANKAVVIIENFSKASKKARGDPDLDLDVEARFTLMREIHQQAAKDVAHAFGRAASAASLLVASSLVADRENIDRVNAVYAQTFADCQKGKAKIQGFFFTDWVNWGMGHAANVQQAAATTTTTAS